MTVKDMKVGDRLLLGKYSVRRQCEDPDRIVWKKSTRRGDFISQYAVDFLCFDAKEFYYDGDDCALSRNMGNRDYMLSNIHAFLNSAEESWYIGTHEYDCPPDISPRDTLSRGFAYGRHYGFLYYFEDFEISSIETQHFVVDSAEIESKIRLLRTEDVFESDSKFNIFREYGIRVCPSLDFSRHKKGIPDYFSPRQFVPYFLADSSEYGMVKTVNRMGHLDSEFPACGSGIRPTCRVKLDAPISKTSDGYFEIMPNEATRISSSEILEFLGLS